MKRRWPLLIVGVIVAAVGLVWTLQGMGVLPGSVMSGSTFWATVGPIVLLVGVVLIVIGSRRRRTR